MNVHEFVLYLRHLCVRALFFRSESTPNAQFSSVIYGFRGQQVWKVVDVVKEFLKQNPAPKTPSDVSFRHVEEEHFFSWQSTDFKLSQMFVIFSSTGYSNFIAQGEVTLDGRDITALLEIQFNPISEKLFLIKLKDQSGTTIAEQNFDD